MPLRDLMLKNSYETTANNMQLTDEFYIPVLSESNKYYRIAGFFSSTSLSIAAKGIEALIHNNGKMYLLVSPELSEEDYKVICDHQNIDKNSDFFDFQLDDFVDDNLKALAWLLDNNRLEIKIVVGKNSRNSLFHQKIGLFFDGTGDIVSFSGSINESAQAWLNNIEEFKVFRSWEKGQVEYLQSDLEKFLSFWKNERSDIAWVYDASEAVKEKIIHVKPKDIWDLSIMKRYHKDKVVKENEISLYPHQKEAVKMWEENNYHLLMEMATGTGKTRTALACLNSKLKDDEKMLVVVATPQNILSLQWKEEVENLNIAIEDSQVIDGTNNNWRNNLDQLVYDLEAEVINRAIIFTTHTTAANDDFIKILRENKNKTKYMLICDEAHGAGSFVLRRGLLDIYDYRVGLSATPDRMFDEVGTNLIKSYFGNQIYEFTIADALTNINPKTGRYFLNSYYYYPVFVELTSREEAEYRRISKQIYILKNKEEYDEEELEKLYIKRADTLKNAEGKYQVYDKILEDLGPGHINGTITFVSPQQLEQCFKSASAKGIKVAKITQAESTKKIVNSAGESERKSYISQFSENRIQMLIGIECLNEGIDIPSAHTAILMSNSTNPREYVQRVGRVIRTAEGKKPSVIIDVIVTMANDDSVLQKEGKRTKFIAQHAINYEEVREKFLNYGVDIDAD